MWQLPKSRDFLPMVSTQQLQKVYDLENHAKAKIRLLSAIHRKRGESIDQIAYSLSKNRRTIHSWIVKFRDRGIEAKDSIKAPGKKPELSLKQRKDLTRRLERGPPHNTTGLWSTKQVRELIAKKYGRMYVKQHVWRMLDSLGFSIQRPRKRHYKRPSDEEVLDFKKKLNEEHDTTGQGDLLWARKMRQHSASSL